MSLALKTEFYKSAGSVAYTNGGGSTVKAGTPVLVAGQLGIAMRDIAPGATDEVLIEGRFRAVKANEAWSAGDVVGYDSDGNPAVGAAGSGCWTKVAANWDAGYKGGYVLFAAAAGDEVGYFLLTPRPVP
jgi:predicted RecA/RadA family phage recombinase